MRAKGIKLTLGHLAWFYFISSILFLSGIAWILFRYFPIRHEDLTGLRSSSEVWCLKIHGGLAMAFLILLGTLIPVHIRRGWSAKLNRPNGVLFITLILILILSGYELYYTGSENLRDLSHWAHIIFGVLSPVFLAWHIRAGRARQKHLLKHTPEINTRD